MSRGTKALVSQSALLNNLARVRDFAPKAKVWAVVKANGYGHDAELVTSVLKDADGFAVSTFAEGIALRENNITQPVILLEGVTDAQHWVESANAELQCVVHCFEQISQLADVHFSQPLLVWLKIDSGMHRLGFQPEQVAQAIQRLSDIENVQLEGLMTHLACADDASQRHTTEQQVTVFNGVTLPQLKTSVGNSAGIVSNEAWQGDWVRPGIMLYGATPLVDRSAEALGLLPVMHFVSPVIAIRHVKQGDKIGYGHRWTAPRNSVIATLAVGYGDGYPRHAPDGTPVYLNGRIVPLCGRVSMDMLMVDVTDLPEVSVGDLAELWGSHLSVDEVAKHIDTIGYELLTRISPRVSKELID